MSYDSLKITGFAMQTTITMHVSCHVTKKKASEISAQNSRPNLHIQLLLSHNDDITSTAHCLLVQRFTRLYAKLPES